MANVAHSTIADAYKHEEKGAVNAAANTVYRADGAGSGSWGKPFNLVDFVSTSSASSATEIELTGLSGYNSALLVISCIHWTNTNGTLVCQIDNSGTYVTTGYNGAYQNNNNGNTVNDFTTELVLARNQDTNRDYISGAWWFTDLNGGEPCVQGFNYAVSGNYMSSPVTGSVSSADSFGRLTTSATVTKMKIYDASGGTFNASSPRYIHLYGIR